MYKIYLDTTIRYNNRLLLFRNEALIDSVEGEFDVVAKIQEILARNSLKISQINDFSMNEGPGSFMGLRAGASIVNALRWAVLGVDNPIKPVYSPSSFDNFV